MYVPYSIGIVDNPTNDQNLIVVVYLSIWMISTRISKEQWFVVVAVVKMACSTDVVGWLVVVCLSYKTFCAYDDHKYKKTIVEAL
jgi:hypothetical protein